MIREYKDILKELSRLSDMRSKMGRYITDEKKLEEEKSENIKLGEELEVLTTLLRDKSEIYKCPECSTSLQLSDGKLERSGDIELNLAEKGDIEKKIERARSRMGRLKYLIREKESNLQRYQELKEEVKKIEDNYDDLPNFSDIDEDLESIRSYKSSQIELEKRLKILREKVDTVNLSSGYRNFERTLSRKRKDIDNLKRKLKNNSAIFTTELDEDNLREIIVQQRRNRDVIKRISTSKKRLELEENTYREQNQEDEKTYLDLYKKVRSEKFLLSHISKREKEIVSLKEKYELHTSNIKKIEEYKDYEEKRDKYLSLQTQIEELKSLEIENRNKYAASILLKEKVLEAESISISNIIATINTHAQIYLDDFFTDNPISVILTPFKSSKKTGGDKPQINIQTEYKGMEIDISMLSGGELSRVILAFTLALSNIFNIPMIMLDECTSSLDQELNTSVVNSIKTNFNGDLILLVMHQAITGIFDRVINF
jgi:DNA repair exonuclease SbcCD ATPase subunit